VYTEFTLVFLSQYYYFNIPKIHTSLKFLLVQRIEPFNENFATFHFEPLKVMRYFVDFVKNTLFRQGKTVSESRMISRKYNMMTIKIYEPGKFSTDISLCRCLCIGVVIMIISFELFDQY